MFIIEARLCRPYMLTLLLFQYLYSSSPNPNLLIGAVVGGPDNRDAFADDRNNYHQSEPATYINAPFVDAEL